MKTKNIRLIVTMITLAAAITISTTPAEAQRRSSKNKKTENVITNKSGNTNSRSDKKTTSTSTNDKRVNQSTRTTIDDKKWEAAKTPRNVEQSDRYKTTDTRNQNAKPSDERTQKTQTNTSDENRTLKQESKGNPSAARNINSGDSRSRNYERTDRYTPSRDYKGSDKYWSGNQRSAIRNENHKNNNYWDRNWEHYRWNDRSWNDYYKGYRPYSFRYDKNYYHHSIFGHVIRRFTTRPMIFTYNHIPYYCYDGYFFNYRRGVGYVLTDLPYGIVFPELPFGYERVNINGYIYFRIGNLFFEYNGYGYQLMYYPERFFAYR